MRRKKTVAVLASLVAVAALVAGGTVYVLRTRGTPEGVAGRYLAAWERSDYGAMRELVAEPQEPQQGFVERYQRWAKELRVRSASFQTRSTETDGDRAAVTYHATVTLAELGTWTYDGRLVLKTHDRRWRVDWSPAALYPALDSSTHLARETTWPQRAHILAADGTRLDGSSAPPALSGIVGSVGPATAEELEQLGPSYEQGDKVGHSGLQAAYQDQLAGSPAGAIQVVDARGNSQRTVARLGGKRGTPVHTTVDVDAQRAAAQAVSGQDKPTALVAVQASTGRIMAVANQPVGYNRAMLGRYPPGSTFKVLTAAALVTDGVGLRQQVPCPATATIGGRTFHNYEYEDFGQIPFRTSFAHSCNTTFAKLATQRLSPQRMVEVAENFGFNTALTPGLAAVRGKFPKPRDPTELAAAAFGQGRVLASPMLMASLAAAVADGTWRPPALVKDDDPTPTATPSATATPHKLDERVVRTVRKLMRSVVTDGTAAGVSLPAGTAGKTGTAEFGGGQGDEEPPTHAWFIGFHGDVAFAALVEGGGTGAEAAAPVAADFLRAL